MPNLVNAREFLFGFQDTGDLMSMGFLAVRLAKHCNTDATLSDDQQISLKKALESLDKADETGLKEVAATFAIAAWINSCKG